MIWLVFIVFLLSQVLDIWTTNLAIKRGADEKNWFILFLMEHFGDDWPLPKLLIAGVLGVIAIKLGYWQMLLGLSAVYFVLAWHNYRVANGRS